VETSFDRAGLSATQAPRGVLALAVVEVDAVPWVDAVSHVVESGY
jgi:hypothetical protein